MDDEAMLETLWRQLRERLAAKHLAAGPAPSLSLRIPGSDAMWFGQGDDAGPRRVAWRGLRAQERGAGLHAAVYAQREDVCGAAVGGGDFGLSLADFGGTMPGVFDEQVRHLGRMAPPVFDAGGLRPALRGGANVVLVQDQPLVLGTTGTRLALNAELFEKCAKAYVLAVAGGGAVKPLPWIVRHVANGRLMKDETRARLRTRQGLLPEESKGY
jgi:hypothetical protein